MIKQYPYTLFVKSIGQPTRDENGSFIPGVSVDLVHAKCRDEANTAGKEINLIDGKAHTFDSLIQLPKNTPAVAVGTSIEVKDGSVIRVKGTVKRFQKDQMHCRLWV